MATDIKEILQQHWGYTEFRPLQEEIINSVLEGNDTLALLPTGGGKSICYQVPALARPGMCLVVSPLIALMKDQVYNLHRRDVKARAIFSGMSSREIAVTLDNCIYGDIELLYVSPERLKTEAFLARLPKMKINLLAVDEAHCISQWGYDFRPPYLEIADIRSELAGVPVLALTASATPKVEEDIQDKLGFKARNVFRQSFARSNLSYVVFKEENKPRKLLNVIRNVRGTGIVYLRSRRGTEETVRWLRSEGISADFYHAGLEPRERSRKQDDWARGRTRVVACTNAFGMGIDKPDVRFVVHLDLPDSLEAYYQEAGRAGRDGKRSYAVLLYDAADVLNFERNMLKQFPDATEVARVYTALAHALQVPVGSGAGESHDFDLLGFCRNFELQPVKAHQALKLLEQQGLINMTDSVLLSPRIMITVGNDALYKFQVEHVQHDPLIKTLLRSYGGLFDHFVRIDEKSIANRIGVTVKSLQETLAYLQSAGILQYEGQKNKPQIAFLTPRYDDSEVPLDGQFIEERRKVHRGKIRAMVAYARNSLRCRSQELLSYFGEGDTQRCGLCDFCLGRNKLPLSDRRFEKISERITNTLSDQPFTAAEIASNLSGERNDEVLQVLRWMIDNSLVKENESEQLIWQG